MAGQKGLDRQSLYALTAHVTPHLKLKTKQTGFKKLKNCFLISDFFLACEDLGGEEGARVLLRALLNAGIIAPVSKTQTSFLPEAQFYFGMEHMNLASPYTPAQIDSRLPAIKKHVISVINAKVGKISMTDRTRAVEPGGDGGLTNEGAGEGEGECGGAEGDDKRNEEKGGGDKEEDKKDEEKVEGEGKGEIETRDKKKEKPPKLDKLPKKSQKFEKMDLTELTEKLEKREEKKEEKAKERGERPLESPGKKKVKLRKVASQLGKSPLDVKKMESESREEGNKFLQKFESISSIVIEEFEGEETKCSKKEGEDGQSGEDKSVVKKDSRKKTLPKEGDSKGKKGVKEAAGTKGKKDDDRKCSNEEDQPFPGIPVKSIVVQAKKDDEKKQVSERSDSGDQIDFVGDSGREPEGEKKESEEKREGEEKGEGGAADDQQQDEDESSAKKRDKRGFFTNLFAKEGQPPERSLSTQTIEREEEVHPHGDTPDEDSEDLPDLKFVVSPENPTPKVKCGTIQRLVERLTKCADVGYRDSFLLTYHAFSSPKELLSLLIKQFRSAQEKVGATGAHPVKLRVIGVLKAWVDNHFHDFVQNSELRTSLLKFLEEATSNRVLRSVSEKLAHSLDRKIVESANTKPPLSPTSPTPSFSNFSLDTVPEEELALQITFYTASVYSQIPPHEFLGQCWNKPEKHLKAPTLLTLISSFNQISEWVTSQIVTEVKLKDRVERMRKLANLAQHLRRMNNFQGVMQILSGVNRACVRRLKKTWDDLSSDAKSNFRELEDLMSHSLSYKIYRQALMDADPPCIPYIGIYLSDLTFIDEGNPSYIEDGLINFQKQEMVARVIMEIKQFQSGYRIEPKENIQQAIRNLEFLSEEEAYKMSMKIEPRNPSEAIEVMLIKEDQLRRGLEELQVRVSQLEEENERLRLVNTELTNLLRASGTLSESRDGIFCPGIGDGSLAASPPRNIPMSSSFPTSKAPSLSSATRGHLISISQTRLQETMGEETETKKTSPISDRGTVVESRTEKGVVVKYVRKVKRPNSIHRGDDKRPIVRTISMGPNSPPEDQLPSLKSESSDSPTKKGSDTPRSELAHSPKNDLDDPPSEEAFVPPRKSAFLDQETLMEELEGMGPSEKVMRGTKKGNSVKRETIAVKRASPMIKRKGTRIGEIGVPCPPPPSPTHPSPTSPVLSPSSRSLPHNLPHAALSPSFRLRKEEQEKERPKVE